MGCGCGGRRGMNSRRSVAPPSQASQLGSGVNARQVQVQSNQRQALIQRAKERIQQQNGNISSAARITEQQKEVERKRRIQVSLRNRNSRTQGNQ